MIGSPRGLVVLLTVMTLAAACEGPLPDGDDEVGNESDTDTDTGESETEELGPSCQGFDELGCGLTKQCGNITVYWGEGLDSSTSIAGDYPCVFERLADPSPSLVVIDQVDKADLEGSLRTTAIWIIGDGTAAVIESDPDVETEPACYEVERYEINEGALNPFDCENCVPHAYAGAMLIGWRVYPALETGVPACE